jgi:hypothetical protein
MKSSKMKISIWIFFAASILTVKGVFDVKINSGNNDFSIEFKGVTLLTHTSNSPMLAIGRGSFDAVDNHGNFVLEDNVTDVVSFDLAVVGKSFEQKSSTKRTAASTSTLILGINEEEGWINLTSSLEAGNVLLLLPNTPTPNGKMELKIDFTQSSLPKGTNRWFLRLPASNDEFIWGAGEQFTYLNLREEANYPIWPREQGVGRNKSSELTQVSSTYCCLLFVATILREITQPRTQINRAVNITGFVVLCKFRQVVTPINQFWLSFFFFL